MAGKYYTMQEVMDKLGKSEQEVKNLVKEGKLRQFLDRGNPLFDPQQVDAMSADEHGLLDLTAAGTDFDLQLEETSAIQLEPDDSTPAAEAQKKKDTDSEGGFGLSMAGKDDDISSSDTVASSMGINILDETDDAYKLTADSLGETKAAAAGGELEEIESLDADGNMESLGSGSGLLDLSLQADDTSLGAVLDDILPSGGGDMPGGDMGGGIMADEPAGMIDEVHETEEVSEISMPMAQADPMIQEIPAGPSAQLVAVSPVDPATSAYGVAMFIPFIILILAAIAVGAGLLDISPSLLGPLGSQMFGIGMIWVIVIAAVLLTIILLAIMATTMGGGSSSASPRAKAAKAAKPKKEKKVKVKKEKKAKK